MEWSSFTSSPEILRLWSGLTCLGGAAERRFFTTNEKGRVYPNLFSLLVTPPGVGKSMIITQIHRLWALTGKLNIASSSVTKAALVDTLIEGRRQTFSSDGFDIYHSVLVASSEFGVLVPSHDLAFLNTLNVFYDCDDRPFGERTRTGGMRTIDKPHMVMLSGTQPKYLAELFPDTAFGMGTTSRIIMVYSGEAVRTPLFRAGRREDPKLFKALLADLTKIATGSGEITWDQDAADAIDDWYMADMPPTPKHGRLTSYNARRPVHFIKLCMIYAMSANRMTVSMEDFNNAKRVLLEAEAVMPQIFKEMLVSDHAAQAEELYNFVLELWLKSSKPVPEHTIVRYLQDRVPANTILFHMQAAIDSRRIRSITTERPWLFEPNLDINP